MEKLMIVSAAALAAGFIQSVTGFGGALVMMMVLPYFVAMKTATALGGLICVPMCIAVALRYRREVQVRQAVFPTAVYLVSSAVFIRIAASINLDSLKAAFGILLVALAAYFQFFSGKLNLKGDLKTAFVCAALSGLTGGLFGVGGPVLVLYYLAVTKDKKSYLGTINFVFAITESYSAVVRSINGLITGNLLPLILAGFCAVLLGSFLGARVVDRLDGERMKRFIYLLLAVSGAITFLRAAGLM